VPVRPSTVMDDRSFGLQSNVHPGMFVSVVAFSFHGHALCCCNTIACVVYPLILVPLWLVVYFAQRKQGSTRKDGKLADAKVG
jgi:hypothetical protein